MRSPSPRRSSSRRARRRRAIARTTPAQGKAIFMADGCYECHGQVGQGGRLTGPRARPHAAAARRLRAAAAPARERDAALRGGRRLGRGYRQHLRLSPVAAGAHGGKGHPAPQPVGGAAALFSRATNRGSAGRARARRSRDFRCHDQARVAMQKHGFSLLEKPRESKHIDIYIHTAIFGRSSNRKMPLFRGCGVVQRREIG